MKIPVPELSPEERIDNFKEVCIGYSKEDAIKEASRCLKCKEPQCMAGCPVGINIPKFIHFIKKEKFDRAIEEIKKKNNLPGVCGRVCPQEQQCEKNCVLKAKGQLNIGKLERFAADNEKKIVIQKISKKKGKVAIIGSGPAGLTAAADLALAGYKVVVFEALHKPGGVLSYGIPSFRLPKSVVIREVDYIKKVGVKFMTNMVVGKSISLKEIEQDFDAIFIAVGAGLPYFMRIEGENLANVYSANEFLTRVNLMKAYKFPDYITPIKKAKKTVVVGGGNVAIDAARVAKRLGAEVTVVYRRSLAEMPARIEEIKHAKEEGIKFLLLTNPVRILGEKAVDGVECIQMMLGEKDETGRRSPIPITGSEFIIDCDQVIVAIGQGPNPLLIRKTDLELGERGTLFVDENNRTSNEKIFAGGDIISGEATVIKAIADGKKAAKEIDNYLRNKKDK
jgi:glutamate synthase (NADPH/NADH) small chain